jgi:hypothetical protein
LASNRSRAEFGAVLGGLYCIIKKEGATNEAALQALGSREMLVVDRGP